MNLARARIPATNGYGSWKNAAELEGVIGKQTLELDFFAGALRKIEESRRKKGKNGATASTPKSAGMQSQGGLSIQRMCEMATVSRASFYRHWEKKAPTEAEMALRDAIQRLAVGHRFYGYRRIAILVQREGYEVGTKKVRRLMKEDNLLAVRRRKFVATTDSGHGFVVYPNLAEQLIVSDVNQLWVADLTCVRLMAEFVYLAVVLDAFSRRAVGLGIRAEFAGLSATGGFGKRDPQPATQDWEAVTCSRTWTLADIASTPIIPVMYGSFTGRGRSVYLRSERSFKSRPVMIEVIDLDGARQYPSIPGGPGAAYLAGRHGRIYVTRVFPTVSKIRDAPSNEIVEIDTSQLRIKARYAIPSGAVFHAAIAHGGAAGIAAALRPKNLIPTAQVEHEGIFGNSLAVFGPGLRMAVTLPLDQIENSLAQPFDVAISPEGSRVFVSASGADELAVIDARRLFAAARTRRETSFRNDLSVAAGYLIARIPTGRNPRGLALSRSGRRLYVANRLDDTITIIDPMRSTVAGVITIGETRDLKPERRGEQHFYSARFAFARQFSCSSCHLDAISDGLSWDLAQDGFGLDIVATKSLEGLAGSAPYKWNGTTPDLETECGQLSERYFFRSQGFRGQELEDVVSFLKAIPIRPNRDRLPNGMLSPRQARGRAIFLRTAAKDGRTIIPVLRCDTCHFGPLFTSNQPADVGTRRPSDRGGTFDTPQLLNLAYRRSFLHDGSAKALRELWELYNPRDLHGVTSDLNPDELDDLIEYLKTL